MPHHASNSPNPLQSLDPDDMAAALLARTDSAAAMTRSGALPPALPARSLPASSSGCATFTGGWATPLQPPHQGLLGMTLSEQGVDQALAQPPQQLAGWPAGGAAAAAMAAQAAPPAAVAGAAQPEMFVVRVSLKVS